MSGGDTDAKFSFSAARIAGGICLLVIHLWSSGNVGEKTWCSHGFLPPLKLLMASSSVSVTLSSQEYIL